ncbi:MAG: M6 family metalloprotease domain-containing protein [Fibrobacter sp.]|nr:M6 family metalloprotease domain-containing protein [Fibrobacter sp.]
MKSNVWKGIFTAGLFGLAANLWAEPENPTPYVVDNQGDTLTIRRMGDEHYNFAQTIDGFLIIQDSTGCFYYADESGNSTSIKAKGEGSRSQKDWKFLKSLDRDASYRAHRRNNPDRLVPPEKRKRPNWLPTVRQDSSERQGSSVTEGDSRPMMRLPKPAGHASGTNRFPVILVAGSGSTNCDSLAYYNRLNQVGYNKDSHTGSVRDYFVDQSSGIFVPSFDVYVVTISNVLSSYKGTEYNLVRDALVAFKNKYPKVDASKYDADGDGYVDLVSVIFAGSRDQAGLGGQQYALKWKNLVQTIGGKKFDSYFIAAQMENSYAIKNIGSFVHEFGHSLGLSDHYSVYNNSTTFTTQYQGTHAWDVMATGMYNNNGATPPGYSAFEKNSLGWLDYTPFDASQKVMVVPPLHDSGVAYKIPVSGNADEWFVLENRQLKKWDAYLPNHGMLIWHIDYVYSVWYGDKVNDTEDHQHVDVVEAGNLPVTSYSDGFKSTHLKDDPFPGSQNVTSFAGFKSWAGVDQGVKLYNITEKNGNICFATASGVDVGDCAVVSSSSSVTPVVSSSSVAVSSSSVAPVASSSSVVPAVSSSSKVPERVEESSSSTNPEHVEKSSSSTLGIPETTRLASGIRMSISAGVLELIMPAEGTKQVKVFDLQGNKIYDRPVESFRVTIDVERLLPIGSYVVFVQGANGLYETRRFINR